MRILIALTIGLGLGIVREARAQNLVSLELLPASVEGGSESQGRVTLDAPAGLEGTRVFISSSDPSVASAERAVVPPGEISALFTVSSSPVDVATQVTFSASLGEVTRTAVLTVEPRVPRPPGSFRLGSFRIDGASYQASTWDPEQGRFTGVAGTGTTTVASDGGGTALPVAFTGLTIENPFEGPSAVAGSGSLSNPPAAVELAGFTLHLESLTLDPGQATAAGKLQLPPYFADRAAAACGGARIDLGSFPFTPDSEFYLTLPQAAFGPWFMGRLGGMEIRGQGLTVDFSTSQSPLTTLLPSFRGVVLSSGDTVAASTLPIANTGYLKAHYGYSDAVIGAAGLTARFDLLDTFLFRTLQPFDFRIELLAGSLTVVDGTFAGGGFTSLGAQLANVGLPPRAVRNSSGNVAFARYSTLDVLPDFDLYAQVTLSGILRWGDLTGSTPRLAYSLGPFERGYLYFAGSYRPPFRPLDVNAAFQAPPLVPLPDPRNQLDALGMSGLTLPPGTAQAANSEFRINTPDTPGAVAIAGRTDRERSWIQVGGQGVHGEVSVLEITSPNPLELGATDKPYYRMTPGGARVPFSVTLKNDPQNGGRVLAFQFVDSAVYRSRGEGSVFLGLPVNASVEFTDLNFTSTAHCPGAKTEIKQPVKLDYWQLDLVQNPQKSSAGPLSVKTGQVFLIGAGIEEKRHFAKPFWLTWGEILASGDLGRFIFDLDSSGQKFDRFDFVAEDLGLSPYDASDALKAKAYLRVAGTAHFDFFGANYFHLHDHYDPRMNPPFNNRRIVLADAVEGDARPTDREVAGDWSGTFGSAAFRLAYDDADQDGFVSDGGDKDANHMQFLWIEGQLLASAVLSAERICLSVHEGFDVSGTHDVVLGPVGRFASMERITGCGCIEGGQLKRVHLQGEGQASADNVVLGAKGYLGTEMDFTPATSDLSCHGDMFVNLLSGTGDIEVAGQARFQFHRNPQTFALESFEGDLRGKISAGIGGGEALGAEGQLSWHVGIAGSDVYHSVQGRLAVAVVAPGGIAGLGLEGGFYFGQNAPSEKAWVLQGTDPRYQLELNLPGRLTGVFGYAKMSAAVSYFVISGGYEIYAGLGVFVSDGAPLIVGKMRAHVWGKFLGGLVSAEAWAVLQFVLGDDPQFLGKIGLKACLAWVFCAEVGVGIRVDKQGINFS